MMGFGSYGGTGSAHGGGSSNLSALAPPFTVDRSIPKPTANPLVDLGEPLNWHDTNPYTYNSSQPAQLPQLDLDPIPPSYNQNPNLFEFNTYYPYVSPPLHVQTFNDQSLSGSDHTAQWGGGLWDWENGKPAQLDGSFYSTETNVAPSIYKDHANLGAHPSKSLKAEETAHDVYSMSRERHVGPPSIEKLDYNPALGQNLSFMPVDFLNASVIGSNSAFPETGLHVPPVTLENCQNNQVPFSTPYEKPVRQHVITPSDSIPAMKSSSGVAIRPAVGPISSASNPVPFKNVSSGINGTDTNLVGNPSNVKEPYDLSNFDSNNQCDPGQLSFYFNGYCSLPGEASTSRTETFSTSNIASKDAPGHLFRAKSGVTFSHISPDNFNLALDNNEPVIAVENPLESLDHYNPPVDSPCWKGAPASHSSPFGSSEPVSVQLVEKYEACNGSNDQALKFIPMNTANMVKLPSRKSSEIRMISENGIVEDGSNSSVKLPSVSILSSREHQPDAAGKAGSHHKKTRAACEIKFSDDISKCKKDNVLVDEAEKTSCTVQQSTVEGRLPSKMLHTSENGVADLKMKVNDAMGCGSSLMSCHAVKNLSGWTSSMEDVSTKQSKFLGKELLANTCISVIVDTMHNLSELLLYHCSNETSKLKEQDLKSLEKVINNLDKCMTNNIGQESVITKLRESTSKERPQVADVGVLSQHVQEKRKHSDKQDEICSDSTSVKSGTDMKVKSDKMTQAIKNILMENFHEKEEAHPQILLYKNLWLEAEAALCSINYMARFNNMKAELGKFKLDSEEDLSEDTSGANRMVRPKLSSVVSRDKKLTAVTESGSTSVSNENSPIRSSSDHADDITARFHVLQQQFNNSNRVHTTDVDQLSSSKFLILDEIDKLSTKVYDCSTPGLSSQDSFLSGTDCHKDDVGASVVSRFHVLKSHGIDNLDSDDMEMKELPKVVDFKLAGKIEEIFMDKEPAKDGASSTYLESVSEEQVKDANQNSPIKSSSNQADDVMARFHVLQQRLNNLDSVHTTNADQFSSSQLLNFDEVDKLATNMYDCSTPRLPSQDSPLSGRDCHSDVESSVMARFHILRTHDIDNLDSDDMEPKQLPEVVDLRLAGKTDQILVDKDMAKDGVSGTDLESVSLEQAANHAVGPLVVNDFHLTVQQDCTKQSPGSYRLGNQLSAGWYDSGSSDWEHVLKEELSGQNS